MKKKPKQKPTNGMTPDRVKHMKSILKRFKREFSAKYIAGQNEHGGVLESPDCLTEASREALDLVAYLTCARGKMHQIDSILLSWKGTDKDAVRVVRSLFRADGLEF